MNVEYGSPDFCALEELGVREAGSAAFVLVAGGLGERLGYSGIKVKLPTESVTGTPYLQLYCQSILALQAAAAAAAGSAVEPLPLAIMTSDDTHARTEALLAENNAFGMAPGQVTLIKQEKVPCLADNEARIALEGADPFRVQTKPHGHGDVHALLHSSGLAAGWAAAGRRWVVFFQDTNALVFKAIPAALGVSSRSGFDINSLAVPRKAKEAIGGLARLTRADGSGMTVNVEYNQLDPLLRAVPGYPEGDANDLATGYSPFPGNINQLVLALGPYCAQLAATGGGVEEFVNPKYKDASKTAFKASTRLECMMQDWPKTVPPSTRVGFTLITTPWIGYSPVKNSVAEALAKVAAGCPPHSAAAGECDMYGACARALAALGCAVGEPEARLFCGTTLQLWPRIVWTPAFAATFSALRAKAPGGASVRISSRSVLLLDGDITLKSLDLDGTLLLRAAPGARVVVDGLAVRNAGWDWVALEGPALEAAPEVERIRGFCVRRKATEVREFGEPGEYVLS